jgi:DNA-directed RNA polymerase subunit RPC12/RpoP
MRDKEREQAMDGFNAAEENKDPGHADVAAARQPVPVIVICEECGRKFRIDPGSITGEAVGFSCRHCGHRILVNKRRPDALGLGMEAGDASAPPLWPLPMAPPAHDQGLSEPFIGADETGRGRRRAMGPGVRRALLLALSLVIAGAAGVLFLRWMEGLARELDRESALVINRVSEEKILGISSAVAAQCRTYLMAHPELTGADFARDPAFGAIALQPVGKTGTTALYERSDDKGRWRIWVHTDPVLNGADLSALRRAQGGHFEGFWKVATGVRDGAASSGYYLWRDPDGKFREKFMVCTAVPGTRYLIAAALDAEECQAPAHAVGKRIAEITREAGTGGILIFGAATLIVLGVALLGGNKTRSATAEGRKDSAS